MESRKPKRAVLVYLKEYEDGTKLTRKIASISETR